MSLKKDVIGAEVQIGSNEAQKSLTDLAQKTSALAAENEKLRISQAKLKALGKEHSEEYKQISSAISANTKEVKANQSQMDALRKTLGLNDMSMKQLKKQAQDLLRELNSMNQGADPERWNKLKGELKATETQIQKVGSQIGNTKGAVNSLADQAKTLLPAFGFAAIGAAAVAAFNKIITATDALSTEFDAKVNGMKEGLNEFWRTIADGDWSNFTDRIRDAIKAGEDYIRTLDDIEEKTRALSIIEANARAQELDLEEKLRNKQLSKSDRIKAGQERIELEKYLSDQRTKVANEEFDNEANLTALQTKLSKEKLMEVISDMDSATKIRAKAYNEQVDQYEQLRKLNTTVTVTAQGNQMRTQNVDTPEMIKLKNQIAATKEADKVYADQIRATGRTTDEQLDKMVSAYVRLIEAQNSAKENTKKVVTQVNSLLAGENADGSKSNKPGTITTKTTAIDPFAAEADKPIDEAWIKAQVDADTLVFAEKKRTADEWSAFLEQKVQENIKIKNQELENDKAITEAQQELKSVRMNAISEIAGSLSDMFEKGSAAQIAFMAIEKAAAIAQIIFQTSIANAKAVAASPLTFGQPWVAINTISAGVSIAGIVSQTIGSLTKKGKKDGGYSGAGSDSEVDGFYHKNEFIASAPAVRNPTVKPVLDVIDMAQRTGTISSLNLGAISGRQSGGYASGVDSSLPGTATVSDSVLLRISEALAANERQMAKIERWQPTVYAADIKSRIDELANIETNRGLS